MKRRKENTLRQLYQGDASIVWLTFAKNILKWVEDAAVIFNSHQLSITRDADCPLYPQKNQENFPWPCYNIPTLQ